MARTRRTDFPTTFSSQPYPLLFVSISGSHLYGFPSSNSDYDLRGVHVTPGKEVLGLGGVSRETISFETTADGYEDEMVTHDAGKYFRLLLKNNGYVLEQVFSPLVIYDGGHLQELRDIARKCITSNHYMHYKGFGYGEWQAFIKKPTKHVKRILYVFRVLMTGIHLMRTGEVQSNILTLNEEFKLPYISQLVAQKLMGYEKDELAAGHGMDFYTKQYHKLESMLIDAADKSSLPKEPGGRAELNNLLIRLREGSSI